MTDRFWFYEKGAPVEYVVVDGQTQEKIAVCTNLQNAYFIVDNLNYKENLDRAVKSITENPSKFPSEELIRDLASFRD